MWIKIISLAVILPLLLAMGIASMLYTQSKASEFTRAVYSVEDQVRADDISGAQEALADIEARWAELSPLLRLWVPHDDVDEVSRRIKSMQVGLQLNEAPMIYGESSALIDALEHLRHQDDLSLSNIM